MDAELNGAYLALVRILELDKKDCSVAQQKQPVGPARLRAEEHLERKVCDLELFKRAVANLLLNTLLLSEAWLAHQASVVFRPAWKAQ